MTKTQQLCQSWWFLSISSPHTLYKKEQKHFLTCNQRPLKALSHSSRYLRVQQVQVQPHLNLMD